MGETCGTIGREERHIHDTGWEKQRKRTAWKFRLGDGVR